MSQEDLLAKLFEQLLDSEEKKNGSNENNSATDSAGSSSDDIFGGIDIEAVMKLGEMLSSMNKPDKNTQLLLALKPHLRPENRSKVDSALKLMKIMSILPLLRESGALDGLF